MQQTAGAPSTYVEMYLQTAERVPDSEALVFPGTRLTYGQLLARGHERASQLQALGVGPTDRFGLLMQNCPEIVEFVLGAAFLGATAVPINTRFKARELAHVVADAELSAVITTGRGNGVVDFIELLHLALPGLSEWDGRLPAFPTLRAVASCDGQWNAGITSLESISGVRHEQPTAEAEDPDAPLLIMYTSGTTANPKGCVLSSGAIVRNALAIVDRLQLPNGDVWWDPLPMFHMGGLMLMSSVFAATGTFISQAHFSPGEALALIDQEQPTVLYPLFPTITLDLIHHPDFGSVQTDNVRLVGSVAPPDVQQRIQNAFPSARVFSAYGITELCGCVAFHSPSDPQEMRLRTCGRGLDGFEMRVVDPEGNQPLPAHELGELVGRGPQMFTGYYGNPEATAAALDEQGYFHTGDLCSIDEHGEISYHGRIKDMLKVGGENVSAVEVESFLATHPGIKMAQIVGVPDPRLLEVPAAFVETAPGQVLSEREVIEFCRGRIASFKVPRYVRFVRDWPMSATKVQKFKLREQLVGELAGGQVTGGSSPRHSPAATA